MYFAAALALVGIAFGLWLCFPDITTYYHGPLNAAGFAGFAFVPAFTSIALVCAIPVMPVWRFFQPLIGVVCTAYCFLRYSWIA